MTMEGFKYDLNRDIYSYVWVIMWTLNVETLELGN